MSSDVFKSIIIMSNTRVKTSVMSSGVVERKNPNNQF